MADVYRQLAKRLDELPQGFPETESGVELKILKKIFSPENAKMALKLKAVPETAEAAAKRLEMPVEDMRRSLDDMAEKRQIFSFKSSGRQVYMLAPFLVGIYEFQVYRLDKDLVDMFEEYLPTLMKTVGGHAPAMARTIPVHETIKGETEVYRYDDIRKMIDQAKSFRVQECICRQERQIEGHPCNHTLENCLGFSREENAYDYFLSGGRVISKEEAIQVLDKAEEEGLVHLAFYNVKEGQAGVCNCCSCCCGVLRGLKEFKAPYIMAKSNFVASIDQETCSACGVCADERCPMDAIAEENGAYTVLPDMCIGCGVCTVTCPTESIAMLKRPESDQNQPPDNMKQWSLARTANRNA
jgi:Na+-translocating ferredoxin:NAD+ oxidoreductase RNF subunit RnfB